jgi:hypothetical protein
MLPRMLSIFITLVRKNEFNQFNGETGCRVLKTTVECPYAWSVIKVVVNLKSAALLITGIWLCRRVTKPYHAHKCIMFVSAALRMNDIVKMILMIVTWRPARSSPDALPGPRSFCSF